MIKKIMLATFLLCFMFLFYFNLSADKIDNLIKNVPGLEKYKDASAVNVYNSIELTINPDYSFEKKVLYIKKILTFKGKKAFSDLKLPYHAEFEKIRLGNCFTITPEGKRIPVPENQINDLNTRSSIMNPLINYRETIINFPQIDPGYFIVLEYTFTNSRREPVTGIEHFQEANPFMYKKFSIKFPAQFKMNTHFDKNKFTFSKEKKGEYNKYVWEIRNSKIIKNENNTPFYLISGNPVAYSFYKDWKTFAREKLDKIKNIEVDGSIKKLAKEVTLGCKSDREKVLAVYKYLAKNFNYQLIVMSHLDFNPQPLTEFVKEKKGCIKDFVALFVSMLKSVGIKKIYPALTLHDYQRFSEIQKKLAIDDLMGRVCVFWNNQLFHPGKSYIPFGFCLYEANVIIGNDNFDMIEFQHPNRVLEKKTFHYVMDANSALVSVRFELADDLNLQFRRIFMDQPQVRRKIFFNRMLREKSARLVHGPDFKNFDKINENLEMEFKLKYEDMLTRQGPYTYFKIFPPFFYMDVSLKDRENDFQIFNKRYSRDEFILELDDTYNFINPVNARRYEYNLGGKLAYFSLNSYSKAGKIYLTREIFIPEAIIKRENYREFKKFIQKIQNPINNMIFLEKNTPDQ